MRLACLYDFWADEVLSLEECQGESAKKLIADAMWASEMHPFDPMEVAIHEAYAGIADPDLRSENSIFHEYPLSGSPPMMTHLHQNAQKERIIAAKGAWEAIIEHASLSETDRDRIRTHAQNMAQAGFRVLGVASTEFSGNDFPENQQDFDWQFEGLIALEDPPKANISSVFQRFYKAGIQLKIITGDYLETALAIARQAKFRGVNDPLTGSEIMEMSEEELAKKAEKVNLFARMFPEAKLKVIQALKGSGEVVAMTGDGVNDAPALKSAHIGVAMGKRGTETAKRAADMIIIDDNLDKMVDAIMLGRRIYSNYKKAVQYIISIHIPIILTVGVPLVLGWKFANIFSPIHIIFFELIMGPTCSIIYENEPMEDRLRTEKPRKLTSSLFSFNELTISIIQGLVITLGVLFLYKWNMDAGYEEGQVRTIAFTTILLCNIILTLVNRSFYYSVLKTLTYKNRLVPIIILISLIILFSAQFVPTVQGFFELEKINGLQFLQCIGVSFISVIWVEGYKLWRRNKFSLYDNSLS